MPATAINLTAFLAALATHIATRPTALPDFVRRRVMAAAGQSCPLCTLTYDLSQPRDFAFPVVAALIPPALGGPVSPDNAFTCCRRCQQQRGTSDLLATDRMPPSLGAQRAAVLLASHNHLLPRSTTTRPADFIQALAQRHAYPRFRVFASQSEAGHSLLGVMLRDYDKGATWLACHLGRQAGQRVHRSHRLAVYQLDEDEFQRVVWRLIDANAFVIALAHRPTVRDVQDGWWITTASPTALRLRRVGLAVPDPAPTARHTKTDPPTLRVRSQHERRRLEAELQAAVRKADAWRQRVNDQHKAHWLDGQEGIADDADAPLHQLVLAEQQADKLRCRLAGAPPMPCHTRTQRPASER